MSAPNQPSDLMDPEHRRLDEANRRALGEARSDRILVTLILVTLVVVVAVRVTYAIAKTDGAAAKTDGAVANTDRYLDTRPVADNIVR